MSDQRFFVGIVCVQVRRDPFTITQENDIFVEAGTSEDEMRGKWVKTALNKYPTGTVASQGVYDITDAALAFAKSTEATHDRG